MSAYTDKLRLEKKTELSKKVFLSVVDEIVEMSLKVDTAEEFVDYLLTIDDKAAIEEFFNQCHDNGGKFCGGSGSGGGTVGGKAGGAGPRRGPGTHIPAPIDYLKTTVKSAWKVREQRQKSQKLKSVTGPLLGITGPYGVRVSRLAKADLSKFSQKDLGVLKTRLESNQRKFNKIHTGSLIEAGSVAAALGAVAAAPAGTAVVTINPVGVAGLAYAYGLSRWKTKHIPAQIKRVNKALATKKGTKVAASIEDLITFQDGTTEDNLPTLEQEIAAVRKELEGMKVKTSSKPSKPAINNVLDLLAAAIDDEDMPEAGKTAINKLMA